MIHEKVQERLNYLKSLVDGQEEHRQNCKNWGLPWIPPMTYGLNICNYENYLKEIEKNGDKNLLVWVDVSEYKTSSGFRPYGYGIQPFVRATTNSDLLFFDGCTRGIYPTTDGIKVLYDYKEEEQ